MLRFVFISFLICFFYNLNSQNFRFHHLTSEDGISQSEIYAFLEDSRGFMWIGTLDGLNRYDGYTIETYNIEFDSTNALSNNTIRCLEEDYLGRIWIGTNDGLNYYDPLTELFYPVTVRSSQKRLVVWSIYIENDMLLIGTDDGLWRTSIQTMHLPDIEDQFYQIQNFSNAASQDANVKAIKKSGHGGIWIQTFNTISQIVFNQNSKEPILIEDFSLGEFALISNIVEDSAGNLWIATEKEGLIRYNPKTGQSSYFKADGSSYAIVSNKCSSIAIDTVGNIWVGTLDNGIFSIRREEVNNEIVNFQMIHYEQVKKDGLNSNLIYSLYVSKDNKLWVGTIGSGVNIYDPKQKNFKNYRFDQRSTDVHTSNFVRSVYADNQNRLWIGTHNNGLFLMDQDKGTFRKLGFGTESVFHIAKYDDNRTFICADGLYLVELRNNELEILSESNFEPRTVFFYVTSSKPGVYWGAFLGGLARISIEEEKIAVQQIMNQNSTPGVSVNNCRIVFYDHERNQLFVGTDGGGLNIVSLDANHYPTKVDVYNNTKQPNSLSNNYVRSIHKDQNQNIWIGTFLGLNKLMFDSISGDISFKVYLKRDGLPNNLIQLIVEDDRKNLWIGTNGGLSNFITEEERFINFTLTDGLQSNEFSEHAAYQTHDGEIILGGINGINVFRPEQIKVSRRKPKTTITEFILSNSPLRVSEKIGNRTPLKKSILVTDTIILSPKQKNIGFEFSAMIYPNAEKVMYEYKLEGYDEDWHITDAKNRYSYYTNLRHGKYVFKVRSTNTDGIWEDSTREIFIHIQTPFKYTYFAFMLYGVIIVLILLYFSHFTIIRYTTKKKMVLEKIHNEELHKLDEIRTKFFINISHDLRTPLTLIKGPLDAIMQERNIDKGIKENLQIIIRNVKRLSYLVEQLLDVRKAERGVLTPKLKPEDIVDFTKQEVAHFTYSIKNKGLKLRFNFEADKINLCFDPGMMSKVYFNIISNAIKFTERGEIAIGIERISKDQFKFQNNSGFDSYVKIEVSDTGCGMSDEEKSKVFVRFYQDEKKTMNGYGIGLSHAKELIDAHQGYIELESKENIGTTIRFYIPERDFPSESKEKRVMSTEDIYIESDVPEEPHTADEKQLAKTVLVVEDNKDMCNFIARELKSSYNILQAYDGMDGFKTAKTRIPDIIVSDLMMPNMDGIELCEQIKSNLKTSHIPVILLTAKVNVETRYKGIETGADDFIPKPFEMEYLKVRIKNILKSRDQLRKLFQNTLELEPAAVTVTSIDEKFLSSLLKEIEAGMSDANFTINSLEIKMRMSHANFYRKIKQLTGQSGQELVHTMRMKSAHQILTDNQGIRVSEVAFMVGFNNPNYFSTCFKRMYGIAPSDLKV